MWIFIICSAQIKNKGTVLHTVPPFFYKNYLYQKNSKKGDKPKMEGKIRVRIPQITSIETALQLYYNRIELSGADIKELFGDIITHLHSRFPSFLHHSLSNLFHQSLTYCSLSSFSLSLNIVNTHKLLHAAHSHSSKNIQTSTHHTILRTERISL